MIIIPFLNGYFIGDIPYFQTNPYTVYRDIPKNPKNQHLFHWHHMPVVPGIFQKHPHTGQGIFLPQAATWPLRLVKDEKVTTWLPIYPQERSESTYYLHLPSIIIKHDDENPHVFYIRMVCSIVPKTIAGGKKIGSWVMARLFAPGTLLVKFS